MYQFPENFWWGAASSASQTEGNENKVNESTWDYWFRTEPKRFWHEIGPEKVCETYRYYKEDVKLMKEVGFNSYRTSIQWCRLIKNFETGEVDQDAVDFYNNYIDALLAEGIEPIFTLYHFDMPMQLQEQYGGWESRHVTDLFALYVRKVLELFGHKVKYWVTFNEPIVPIEGGYLYDFHYPAKKDMQLAIQAAYFTMLAHAKAVEVFREMKLVGEIGVVLNITPVYARSQSKEDRYAAKMTDMFFNRSFMDPLVGGHFNKDLVAFIAQAGFKIDTTAAEKALITQSKIDFLGLNYYVPRRVKAKESAIPAGEELMPHAFFDPYSDENGRFNPYRANDEIFPQAVYDMAMDVKNNYGNIKWYISELGIAMDYENEGEAEPIDDSYRTELFKEHLVALHQAIRDGSNCFGVHQWTFIDCWSWLNSFKRRYGFYRLDLKTGKRTIKKHGYFYRELAKNNGFES